MTVLSNITFDCADAATLAGFWSQVLGRPLATSPAPSEHRLDRRAGHDSRHVSAGSSSGPGAKPATKNRVHVDLGDRRPQAVERLVALGATRVDDKDEFGLRWTVLRDPEGNRLLAGPEAVQTPGAGAGAELSAPPRWTDQVALPARSTQRLGQGPVAVDLPHHEVAWGGPAAGPRRLATASFTVQRRATHSSGSAGAQGPRPRQGQAGEHGARGAIDSTSMPAACPRRWPPRWCRGGRPTPVARPGRPPGRGAGRRRRCRSGPRGGPGAHLGPPSSPARPPWPRCGPAPARAGPGAEAAHAALSSSSSRPRRRAAAPPPHPGARTSQ